MGFILRGSTAKKRARKDTATATPRTTIMDPTTSFSISSSNSIVASSISSSNGATGAGGEWKEEGFITRTMPLSTTPTSTTTGVARRNNRHSKGTKAFDAIIAGQHPSKVKMRSPKSQLEFDAFLSFHTKSKDSLDNLSNLNGNNHTGGFVGVHDFPSFDTSERATAATNCSSVPTHKAGNVTLCDSISLVLTAMVCLSLMEQGQGPASMQRPKSFSNRLLPNPERIVRESLMRYISFHLNQYEHKDQDDSSLSSSSVQVSAQSLRHLTPDKANLMARQSLAQRNFKGAILIYETLLAKQPLDGSADTYERALTLTKLGILCLSVRRNNEALTYTMQAMQLHQENDRPLQAAWTEMQVGLIHFGSNKVVKAQKSWREATQRICATCGYDNNMHVAVLLCNIGVLHYESGNVVSCIRSLEESIELQRKVMSSTAMHIDTALFQLATTMGNLAVACERRYEYDKAMALLEESLTLLESIDSADTSPHQQRVEENLGRLADVSAQWAKTQQIPPQQQFNGIGTMAEQVAKDLKHEIDDDDQSDTESIDSVRSAQLFGNSDGIPSRRATARLSLEIADNHDFILLGRLHPEMSAEERVNETVLSWFGKRVDRSVPFVAFDATYPVQPRYKESIKVDIDEQHVLNAELHLKEIHSQAMEHLDHDEVEDALDIFRTALRSHRDKYGEMHHLVGSAWHNIGMIHLYAKQYGPAHVAFLEAVKVRTAALGPNHPDVQASMMKIGMIHLATSDLPKARNTFWDIRDKFLEVLGYGHPQLAKIVNNIGVVCYECGDLFGANRSFEIAYEYQIRLREEVGEENEVVDLAIANTLSNIGFLYVKAGELVQALRVFEEALNMRTKYLEPKDPHLAFLDENIQFLLGRTKDSHCDSEGCLFRPGMCLMSLF